VNYRINDDGSYNTKAPGIETINVVAVVDISFPEWKIAKEFIFWNATTTTGPEHGRCIYKRRTCACFLTADKFSRTPVILYNATVL
jgi:hypothetical protein